MAQASSSNVSPVLRELQAPENQPSPFSASMRQREYDISVLLVPDAGTSKAVHLSGSAWEWLSKATQSASIRTQFLEYQYSINHRDASVWQSLNDNGETLLLLLLEHVANSKASQYPIILVSNSLGGIVAKKFLTRLSDRYYDPVARTLSDRLSQIIFIGCPHPTLGHRERWPLLDYILRHERKLSGKALKVATEEAGIVASLCSKFQEAGIYWPVLTTFESRPSKVRSEATLLSHTEKRILVPQEFAETNLRGEKMLLLDLENRDIRSLVNYSSHTHSFIQSAVLLLKEAIERKRLVTSYKPLRLVSDKNLFESTASEGTAPQESVAISPQQATAASTQRSTSSSSLPAAPKDDTRRTPRLPCYILGRHSRNRNFSGRSNVMRQLDDSLLPNAASNPNTGWSTLRSFALCGLGGMGKTQIALEYAHTRSTQFDAIFWIQANERTSIAESFGNIATSLGLADASEVSDLAVSFSIVMQWLTDPIKSVISTVPDSEASWLIIFDNADSIELLSDFWPANTSGSVLITSRDPAAKDFCLGCGMTLSQLPFDDTRELFMRLLNEGSEEIFYNSSDVESLLRRFGGLPLAVVQIASLIRRRSMTINEFAAVYDRSIQDAGLAEYQASQNDIHYHHTLFTVWAFEDLNNSAQSLLDLMSLLDPFNIQEFILTARHLVSSNHQYPATNEAYVTARSNLLRSSLITRDVQSAQVALHPLVQEIVQARMPEPQLSTYFSLAVGLVHSSWPSEGVKWGHETSHREQSGQLLPHALKLRATYEKHPTMEIESTTEALWIELLKESGWYLYERGEHGSALPIFHLALKIAQGRNDEKPTLLADVLMCLAAIGVHTSTPTEVLDYSREHLRLRQQIAQRLPGPIANQVHYDLAMGYATVAMALMVNNQFDEAIEQAERALQMYFSFDLYKDWKTIPFFAVAHAGWSLWSVGRYEEAEKLLFTAVEAEKARNASYSYGLGGILLPLGNVQASLGKHDEAFVSHQAALDMFYAANGNNYKTAQARLKVAEHLSRKGRFQEAWQNFQSSIASFSQNKFYKAEQARAMIKAAKFQFYIGDAAKAEELYTAAKRTLDDDAKAPHHTDTLEEDYLTKIVRIWSR